LLQPASARSGERQRETQPTVRHSISSSVRSPPAGNATRRGSVKSPSGSTRSPTSSPTGPRGPRVSVKAVKELEGKFTERDLERSNHMLEIMASHDDKYDALNKHARTSVSSPPSSPLGRHQTAAGTGMAPPPSLTYAPRIAAGIYGIGEADLDANGEDSGNGGGGDGGLSKEDREFWTTAVRHADDQVVATALPSPSDHNQPPTTTKHQSPTTDHKTSPYCTITGTSRSQSLPQITSPS
jgi:hypothetical protein